MNIKKKSVAFTVTLAMSVLTMPMTGAQAESTLTMRDAMQRQIAHGIQTVPKETNRRSLPLKGPNPFLSQVIDPTKVNFYGWRKRVESQARAAQRTRNVAHNRVQDLQPILVDELEPADLSGVNDTLAGSERIGGFGVNANPRANVIKLSIHTGRL